MRFTIYAILPLISSLSLFGFGFFVLSRNSKSQLHQTFFLLCSSTGFWAFGYSLMYASLTVNQAVFWARIGYIGVILIPISLYHFTISLLRQEKPRLLIYSLYFSGFIWVALTRTNYFINGMFSYFWGYYPKVGFLYPFWVLFYVGLFLRTVYFLCHAYADKTGRYTSTDRQQIKYVLLAFGIATFSAVDYLQNFKIEIYPFGYVIAFICIPIISYAILRHRLLDIEVVIKRTAVYSLLTALLTGIFLSVIIVSDYWVRNLLGQSSVWVGILAAFAVALAFQPLRDAIQKVVDHTFFRARYDYQRVIGKYSHALAQPMTDLDRFSHIAPYLLTRSMKLSGASVMVLDRGEHCYKIRAGVRDAEILEGTAVPDNSPLIAELMTRKREIIRDDVKDPRILQEMDRLRTVLIIPSISWSEYFKGPTMLSTINLGKKLSDESFSKEDIDFLKTLANQAAISIEYAFILEELKKNQAQLIKSEKLAALGTTTAGIAHELKNPLTYLLTVAQSMVSSWDNPAFKESVGKMLPSEVERMKLIIDGLSDYSKAHELRLEPVDVIIVLEKVLAILGYEIKKNNVFIVKNFPAEGKAMANADKNRLVQIFMNLIANAIQAMGEKGGNLSITVREENHEVRISISDTGPGMPPETLQKIFDPFFTTKESGTGLGLSITKKLIDEHNGSLYAESHVGEGTTFTVCLPAG